MEIFTVTVATETNRGIAREVIGVIVTDTIEEAVARFRKVVDAEEAVMVANGCTVNRIEAANGAEFALDGTVESRVLSLDTATVL